MILNFFFLFCFTAQTQQEKSKDVEKKRFMDQLETKGMSDFMIKHLSVSETLQSCSLENVPVLKTWICRAGCCPCSRLPSSVLLK